MLRRLPLSVKSALFALALALVVGAAQLWSLRWAARADGTAAAGLTPRVALAIGLPMALACVVCGIYAGALVRYRGRAILEALQGIERGDLTTTMPPAPDAELLAVREAFERMGASLRDLTSRLAHADAQRRRLFADLAHELATPVSTILAISEGLDRDLAATPEARARLLRALGEEATRLERLVGDVRDLAHLEDPDVGPELRPADIGEIAMRAAERLMVASQAAAPILVQAEPARALVDPLRIDQALVNLLTNAQRHTPREGTIEVRVEADAGCVRVTVEDSGEGVPSTLRERLGERLFRADPSRDRATGGHGLGLAIVGAIVDQHGGVLRFERASLGGLRVVIELPADASSALATP